MNDNHTPRIGAVTRPSRQGQADGFSGVSFSSARTKHQREYGTPHPDTRRLPITRRKEDGMMTNDEIWTIAREYAKHECAMSTLQDKKQLHEDKIIEFIDVVGFLCETHCIVSKEKVRKLHTAELDMALFYTRKANSCCNNTCRSAYEGSKDAALSRASLLESLFDAETFKNSEV